MFTNHFDEHLIESNQELHDQLRDHFGSGYPYALKQLTTDYESQYIDFVNDLLDHEEFEEYTEAKEALEDVENKIIELDDRICRLEDLIWDEENQD